MRAHELIKRLVDDAGGELPVAVAMGARTFQGTLYKITHGGVDTPRRSSAARIARHFKIPIEAIYDDRVAERVFRERFQDGAGSAPFIEQTVVPLIAAEPTRTAPPWPLKTVTPDHLAQLTPLGLQRLEDAMLERIDELLDSPRFGTRKPVKQTANAS